MPLPEGVYLQASSSGMAVGLFCPERSMKTKPESKTVGFTPVPPPPFGKTIAVQASFDCVLQLGAWLLDSLLNMEGESLIILVPQGGALVITNFFTNWPDNAPRMEIAGYGMTDGHGFLEYLAPDLLDAVQIATMRSSTESVQFCFQNTAQPAARPRKASRDLQASPRGCIGILGNPNFVAYPGELVLSCCLRASTPPRREKSEKRSMAEREVQLSITLQGAGRDVFIRTLTINTLPLPAYGTLCHLGQPLARGQSLSTPNLDGFSFRPAPAFSGTVPLSFSYLLDSASRGPASSFQETFGMVQVPQQEGLEEP